MNRRGSTFRLFVSILFSPLSLLWRLLNQFLLSPWGLIVPMALLIALFVIQQLQKTPAQLAMFYAEQLETCTEAELPQLLEVLDRLGDAGIPGLVKGLTSNRESVFIASRNVLRQKLDHWQESDRREHFYLVFSEALLQTCGQLSPAAQDETVRFVDQIMQIRSTTASLVSAADRQKTITHCERILSQLESQRRRRIDPQGKDFAAPNTTVASLSWRTKQPPLLASNGQPFMPTVARNNEASQARVADAGSFNALSVARADRLAAYQKSLQNRPTENGGNPRLSEDRESPALASFSSFGSEPLPSGFASDIERKIALNFSPHEIEQTPTADISIPDISEGYRNKKLSESNGIFDSDNFLPPELQNTPLDRVPNLPTTQLMRLLHHPEPPYIDSARKTLMSRDGFREPHMKLAWRLYHPIPAVRLEIVEMIPNTSNVQPSGWLEVLLNDPCNDVRYRTASFLATTNDPALQRLLIDRGKRDNDARIVYLADRLNESQRESVHR